MIMSELANFPTHATSIDNRHSCPVSIERLHPISKKVLHLACFAHSGFMYACFSPVDVARRIAGSSMLACLQCSRQRLLWHGLSFTALLPCIKCCAMLQLLEWEPLGWVQLKALHISQLLSASLW